MNERHIDEMINLVNNRGKRDDKILAYKKRIEELKMHRLVMGIMIVFCLICIFFRG